VIWRFPYQRGSLKSSIYRWDFPWFPKHPAMILGIPHLWKPPYKLMYYHHLWFMELWIIHPGQRIHRLLVFGMWRWRELYLPRVVSSSLNTISMTVITIIIIIITIIITNIIVIIIIIVIIMSQSKSPLSPSLSSTSVSSCSSSFYDGHRSRRRHIYLLM